MPKQTNIDRPVVTLLLHRADATRGVRVAESAEAQRNGAWARTHAPAHRSACRRDRKLRARAVGRCGAHLLPAGLSPPSAVQHAHEICSGTGLTPQLRGDWAHPCCHMCTGTGLAPATSALGLGSPPSTSASRDWAQRCHFCIAGLGSPPSHLPHDSAQPPPYLRPATMRACLASRPSACPSFPQVRKRCCRATWLDWGLWLRSRCSHATPAMPHPIAQPLTHPPRLARVAVGTVRRGPRRGRVLQRADWRTASVHSLT